MTTVSDDATADGMRDVRASSAMPEESPWAGMKPTAARSRTVTAVGTSLVSQNHDVAFAQLLLSSHQRLTGTPLCPSELSHVGEMVRWLYEDAPFGLLAHDTSADPIFTYANTTAQRCFEYTWEEFTRLPSRLSAAPEGQSDREGFVRSVTEHGFASGYRGLRISKSGRRFWIEDVTMWNLVDADGSHHGQAAVFRSWTDAPQERAGS
ncbi:MEKHLA domain-containing protein [Streptomyces sp. NPDC086519]|uniref:MEKHLA domain-containing protein n=1 Tax=Streptomyces sp. NPDC086519 TaxID=3154863 RepID=UPI003433C440